MAATDQASSETAVERGQPSSHPPNHNWASNMEPDDRRVAFAQEWENLRYQDRLWWSRIQTLTAIEGGMLIAAYGETPVKLEPHLAFAAALIGAILVVLVSALADKDRRDAQSHLNMLKSLEGAMKIGQFTASPIFGKIKGSHLMSVALCILNTSNVAVLVERAANAW